jgi:hypothetical protein
MLMELDILVTASQKCEHGQTLTKPPPPHFASRVCISVGKCYVHGIMGGEAMQDTTKWHASLRDTYRSEMILGDRDRP